jgi:hypothetical protein
VKLENKPRKLNRIGKSLGKGQKTRTKKKKEKGPNEIHRRDPLTDFRSALTEEFLAELSGYWTIFGQKDLLAP